MAIWYLLMGRWPPLEEIDERLALKVGKIITSIITSVGTKGLKHNKCRPGRITGICQRMDASFQRHPRIPSQIGQRQSQRYDICRMANNCYTSDNENGSVWLITVK